MPDKKIQGERWDIIRYTAHCEIITLDENGLRGDLICEAREEKEAELICALHNAALKINPNIMAVAEGMETLIIVCEKVREINHDPTIEAILRSALEPITKPATKESDDKEH